MPRIKSTDDAENQSEIRNDVVTKPRTPIIKPKEKSNIQSLIIDKSSFRIGFFIGSFLLSMFIIGCIVGSTVI